MKTPFNSFFIHQKITNSRSKAISVTFTTKLVCVSTYNVFESYVFVEHLISNPAYTLKSSQYNLYYYFLAPLSNLRSERRSKVVLDTFTAYFAIVLRFIAMIKPIIRLNAQSIEVSPVVFFFRYYNKAFISSLIKITNNQFGY